MSYSLAIVKSALGPDEAQAAFDALLAAQIERAKLLLFADCKFDGRELVVTRNIESGYGTAAIFLRNTALLAASSGASDDYGREAFDLLCLERAVTTATEDCFFLMRQVGGLGVEDMNWLERNEGDVVREVPSPGGGTNYLFDCRKEMTRKAISLVLDLYRSGALLSLSDASLGGALRVAMDALSKGDRASHQRTARAPMTSRAIGDVTAARTLHVE